MPIFKQLALIQLENVYGCFQWQGHITKVKGMFVAQPYVVSSDYIHFQKSDNIKS